MRSINQYQNVQVMTADGVRIIVMLYEGIVRFNRQAQDAMRDGEVKNRGIYINKSIAILAELINSLNMEEGGEIATSLYNLYEFSIQQIAAANIKNDPALLDSVNKVINELKGGWEAVEKAGVSSATAERPRERMSISHGA